mgnify:FL=1
MHAVAGVAADTLGLLQVLALGVAFLAVSTVTSVSLLEGSIESSTIIGPTFGDIESFFVDMFVFTVSSENYPDVVGTAWPRTSDKCCEVDPDCVRCGVRCMRRLPRVTCSSCTS